MSYDLLYLHTCSQQFALSPRWQFIFNLFREWSCKPWDAVAISSWLHCNFVFHEYIRKSHKSKPGHCHHCEWLLSRLDFFFCCTSIEAGLLNYICWHMCNIKHLWISIVCHVNVPHSISCVQQDYQVYNPSKMLVDEALYRWGRVKTRADNTSVVTVMLDPAGPSRNEVLLRQRFLHRLRPREELRTPEPQAPASPRPGSLAPDGKRLWPNMLTTERLSFRKALGCAHNVQNISSVRMHTCR